MKKQLFEEITRIHNLTYGQNQVTENILSQIFNSLFTKKDNSKKAEYVTDDVKDFFMNLEKILHSDPLSKKVGKELKYEKDVETIQIALQLLGYPLPIYGVDGLFGPETERAVKKFNLDQLNSDSKLVNNKTILRMLDLLKKKNLEPKDLKQYISSTTLLKKKYQDKGISNIGSELLNDPDFSSKLDDISSNLQIDRDWLIQVMMKESRMNPYVTNNIGCVGLIQFCPDSKGGVYKKIGKYNVNLSELKTLSPLAQLDLIEEYYRPYVGRINSVEDLYLVTFYPAALGKSNSYVVGGKTPYGLKISKQNPAIARSAGKTPGKHYLTVGDIKQFVS